MLKISILKYSVEVHCITAVLYLPTGQFQDTDISVTEVMDHHNQGVHKSSKEEILARGILRWGSEGIPVTLQDKMLKDSLRKHHPGKCWVVPKAEIERFLGHSYESYVVNHV